MSKVAVQNITFKEDGRTPQLSGEQLQQLCELGITISDTETTGLQRGKAGLSEFASIRAVKAEKGEPNIDGYKLELFHCFVLPFRPEYQTYQHYKKRAEENGEPIPEYNREAYEYDIAPAALDVTGTRFIRKSLDGPLTGMKVLGEKVDAHPFYEVWDEIQAFTHNGKGDVYYNTPFDKPFLDALSDDLKAFNLESTEIDAEDPYKNSSLYQCLLFNYMQAGGIDASNRLDDAFRKLVDPDFTEREEHSGIEDILMAAKVACKIAEHRKAEHLPAVPSMQELYALLVHKIDPKAHVRLMPPRSYGKEETVLGDIEIQFSNAPEALGPDAVRLWHFLSSFDKVTKLNSRVPKHLIECDAKTHRVTINAERKQPLSLNFLKKWMLFDQLGDHPSIQGFYPFDSTGTHVDVMLREEVAKKGGQELIHDVSLGSLRANQQFLRKHPELTLPCLDLIQRIRKLDNSIGIVTVRLDEESGTYQIGVSGHQRQFGQVRFALPKGARLEEAAGLITPKMDRLLKLGVIPYMQGLEYGKEEEEQTDTKRGPEKADRIDTTVDASSDTIQLTLSPLMLQMVALQMGKSPQHIHQLKHIPTQSGNITIERQIDAKTHEEYYRLSGSMEAFWDFSIIQKKQEVSEEAEIGNKPSSIIRNASWIVNRLEKLPGTYGIKLKGKMLLIEQKDGVSLEALNLLQRLELLPFKAYKDHIKIDARVLMQDAFSWSQALSRLEESRKAEQDRPLEKQQFRARQSVKNAHQALLKGHIQAVEVDDYGTCWALDGSKNAQADGADNHYPISGASHPFVMRDKKHIDPLYSPIRGKFHLEAEEAAEATYLTLSNEAYSVWKQWRQSHNLPHDTIELDQQTQRSVTLRLPHGKVAEKVRGEIEHVANALLELSKLTGIARMPIQENDMELAQNNGLDIRMPELGLFHSMDYILSNLMEFHSTLIREETDALMRDIQKKLPDPKEADCRKDNLFLLCERLRSIADTLDALDKSVSDMQGKSAEVNYSGNKRAQGKILATLEILGSLIHEASSELSHLEGPEDVAPSLEYVMLEKSLNAISMVREKLFRLHTANLRLDEQIGVLRKAMSDHGENSATSLRGAINQTTLFLVDQHALDIERQLKKTGDAETDYAVFKQAMDEAFRHVIEGLYALEDSTEQETSDLDIASVCRTRSYAVLQQLSNAGKHDQKSMENVARYILEKGCPDWDMQKIQSVIMLYRGHENPEALLEAAGFEHVPPTEQSSIEGILLRYSIMRDRNLPEQERRALNKEEQDGIQSAIASAFKARANAYLHLMHEVCLDQDAHHLEEYIGYKQNAETCLKKAGYTDEEIKERIEKVLDRKEAYAASTYSDARNRIDAKPMLDSAHLSEHLLVIDKPEHEARARALLEQQALKRKDQFYKKIEQDLPEPYSRFKQHKALLNVALKVGEEIEDLSLIKFHMARDLSAVITLLLNEPRMRSLLRDDMMQAIEPIVQSLKGTPQEAGLHDEVDGREPVAETHHYRRVIGDSMNANMQQALDNAGIEYSFHTDSEPHWLHIPPYALAKWVDICAGKSTVPDTLVEAQDAKLALPDLKPLSRRDSQTALRYAQSLFGTLTMRESGHDSGLRFASSYPNAHGQDYPCRVVLDSDEQGNRYEYDRFIPKILSAFAEGPWKEHCRLSKEGDETSLEMDFRLVPAVSALVMLARSLSKIDAIHDIVIDPESLHIACEVTLPSGRDKRDQLKGRLQYASEGILPVKLSGFTKLDSGKAGETRVMHVRLAADILNGKVPEPHAITAEEARNLLNHKLRAEGMPSKERKAIDEKLRNVDPAGFRNQLNGFLQRNKNTPLVEGLRKTLSEEERGRG